MDPASTALGIGGAFLGPIFGLIGQLMSRGDREAAMRLRQQAMDQYNIQLPPVEHIAAQQVQTNPQDAQAQRDVYSQLLEQGKSGALRPQDRARLNEVQNTQAAQEKGSRDAILSNMAERGMGGSGAELAAQLSNQQAGAQRASNAGIQVAGQADARAQQALMSGAELAAAVRGQDTQEGEYNATARNNANIFNVGQNVADYQRRVDLADRRAQAQNTMADTYDNRGNQTQATMGGVGQAAGAGASAVAQGMNYDAWLKKQGPQPGSPGPWASGYGVG